MNTQPNDQINPNLNDNSGKIEVSDSQDVPIKTSSSAPTNEAISQPETPTSPTVAPTTQTDAPATLAQGQVQAQTSTPPPPPPIEPEKETPAKIDTGQYDMNVTPPAEPTITPQTQVNNNPIPPVKKPSSSRSVALITSIAILFLVIGFSGGFLGYKYSPQLRGFISSSADSNSSVSEEASTVVPPKNTNSEPGDISAWQIYANTQYKYSIKYPDNWYSKNTSDPIAKTVQFASFELSDSSSSTPTGYKVETVVQDSNSKSLLPWIEANNVASGVSGTPKEITVGNEKAYQQTITGISKSIATYIERGDKILIISYYAPDSQFDTGKKIYDKMIGTIKLTQ